MKNIKKVLTFRASSVGDCLMGKYLLENVHAEFPQARCGIVVANHGDLMRDLFSAYPWLEVIEANRRNSRSLSHLWTNFHGSDLVVTQYAGKKGGKFSLASKLAARLLAKRGGLIGFVDASKINALLYDKIVSFTQKEPPALLERKALGAAGIPVRQEWPTLNYIPDSRVTEKHGLTGAYLVVHLFAGNKSRGLHPEKKRELLTALHTAFPDTRLVISGGKGDRAEAEQVAEGLNARVLAGETTLQEMMNLIVGSRGVVSVDTGMAHMTAQLGKPLVVLAGCLGIHWWQAGQYAPETPVSVLSRADLCTDGHKVNRGYSDCLGKIAIPEVVSACAKVLV